MAEERSRFFGVSIAVLLLILLSLFVSWYSADMSGVQGDRKSSGPIELTAWTVDKNDNLTPFLSSGLDGGDEVTLFFKAKNVDQGVIGLVVRSQTENLFSAISGDLTDGGSDRLVASSEGVVSVRLNRANSPLRACALVGANHTITAALIDREWNKPFSAVTEATRSCVDLKLRESVATPAGGAPKYPPSSVGGG